MAVVIHVTGRRAYLFSKVQEQVNSVVIWVTLNSLPQGMGLYKSTEWPWLVLVSFMPINECCVEDVHCHFWLQPSGRILLSFGRD